MPIATDKLSEHYRARTVRHEDRRVLIARLSDSREATDRYSILNCDGYGRIRTFRDYKLHLQRPGSSPRAMLRGHPPTELLRTQVFQIAACNWRCWYCFVDDDRLSANKRVSRWFTAEELVDLYLSEPNPPDVLDLSGGQPDLVPEWCLWMMQALEARSLRGKIYVWVDDNLSTSNVLDCLDVADVAYMASFPHHSRVGCFKGFDEESFTATTRAEPAGFGRQFEVFSSLMRAGFDMYAYATFTTESPTVDARDISGFVDRLQAIHPNLPLRTAPLKIYPFAAARARLNSSRETALASQHVAYKYWVHELERRFPARMRRLALDAVPLD